MTKTYAQRKTVQLDHWVEALEPRVLYSAEQALLLPVDDAYDAALTDQQELRDVLTAEFEVASRAESQAVTLVFVDAGVPNPDALIAPLLNGADADRVRVVVIAANEDGVARMTDALADAGRVAAVHVVSHGVPGSVSLGNASLGASTLEQYRDEIATWGSYLAEDAQIAFYGCDLAANESGQQFVHQMSELTDADIAASTDKTGAAEHGGDWDLEFSTNAVATDAVFDSFSRTSWGYVLGDITITFTDDVVDSTSLGSLAELLANPGADGEVSLREAVLAARNDTSEGHTITLSAGTFALTLQGFEDNALGGDLDLTGDISIQGAGIGNTVLDGSDYDRVFEVLGGASVSIQDLTISNGENGADGGAIEVKPGSTLHLERVHITDSESDRRGGAIYINNADVSMVDVTVFNNEASREGGGVFIRNSDVSMERVTVHGNISGDSGGGLAVEGGNGTVTLEYSTISGNEADDDGGGIHATNSVVVNHSTIAFNQAGDDGGGLSTGGSGRVDIQNSIVSNNQSDTNSTDDIDGNVVSQGFTIFGNPGNASTTDTDYTGIDPDLQPLANNGGDVLTHALGADSIAINKGSSGAVGTTDAAGQLVDQVADIGAYESSADSALVYWSDGNGSIFRSPADFSDAQQIVDSRTNVGDIEVDLANGRVYWLEGSVIFSANLDGSDIRLTTNTAPDAVGIAVQASAGSVVLFSIHGGATGSVIRHDLSLGSTTVFDALPTNDPFDIEYDATSNRLYWAQGDEGAAPGIYSMATDGSDLQRVSDVALAGPGGFAVAPGGQDFFWTLGDSGVHGALLGSVGAQPASIATGFSVPGFAAYDADANRVLWTSTGNLGQSTWTASGTVVSGNSESLSNGLFSPTGIDIAMISASSNALPVVSTSEVAVDEGAAVVITSAQLNALDADNSASELQFSVVTGPADGVLHQTGNTSLLLTTFTVQDVVDGLVSYTHNGLVETNDTIALQLTDGDNTVSGIDIAIAVNALPDPPALAANTGATVTEGMSVTITALNLSAVDEDSQASDLVYTVVTQPQQGELLLNGVAMPASFTQQDIDDGLLSFVHDGSNTIADSIEFQLGDGTTNLASNVFDFTIVTVDDPAVVNVLSGFVVQEGGVQPFNTTSINVTDEETDAANIRFDVVSQPTNGEIRVSGISTLSFTQEDVNNGLVAYHHNDSESNADVFRLSVFVGADSQGDVEINVSVLPQVDESPVGNADQIAVAEGEIATVLSSGATTVLDNDTDDDLPNDSLEVQLVQGPQHGVLAINPDGTFSYTHDGSETRTDAFTYQVEDSAGQQSLPTTVSIVISDTNDAPQATSTAWVQSIDSDTPVQLPAMLFVDADADALTYTASLPDGTALPGWLMFDSAAGEFAINASADPVAGDLAIVVRADDGRGGVATTDLLLQVGVIEPQPPEPDPEPEPEPEPEPVAPDVGEVRPTVALSPAPVVVELPTVSIGTPDTGASDESAAPLPSDPDDNSDEPAVAISASIDDPVSQDGSLLARNVVDLEGLISPYADSVDLSLAAIADVIVLPIEPVVSEAMPDVGLLDLSLLLNIDRIDDQDVLAGQEQVLDYQRKALQEQADESRRLVGTSVTLTSGLSLGYLIWLIRGGTLMGSVLSSLPAWRLVDPLPILNSLDDSEIEDSESLESLVDNKDEPLSTTLTPDPESPSIQTHDGPTT